MENKKNMKYTIYILEKTDQYKEAQLTLNVRGPSYLGLTRSIS